MKEILETKLIESEKSVFLVDLVRHESSKIYIEIIQSIADDNSLPQTIKINPLILTDLFKVLQNYEAKTLSQKVKTNNKHLTEADRQKIQDRYLKGVSIRDLTIQFDQSKELIEMVLRNSGIEITPNELPKKRYCKKSRTA